MGTDTERRFGYEDQALIVAVRSCLKPI
jgi:hypothetical protein